jgi:hypothetical protein
VSLLERYSDNAQRTTQRRCECGNPKSNNSEGCRRCLYLDGRRRNAEVIRALRGTDGLSVAELCVAVYGFASKRCYTVMSRMVATMVGNGRLRRYQQDASYAGGASGWSAGKGGYTSWIYALDGKTEARK